MFELYYNSTGVVSVTERLEKILREVDELTPEEAAELYRALLRKIVLPLDPRNLYDDWDDPEVDAAYADPR